MNEERQRQTGSGGRVGGMNGRVRPVIRPSTGTRHDNKRYVSVSWGVNITYFSFVNSLRTNCISSEVNGYEQVAHHRWSCPRRPVQSDEMIFVSDFNYKLAALNFFR